MGLTEFIEKNRERILGEWVAFARTLEPWSKGMSDDELRDHAHELLAAIVVDMNRPQSTRRQSDKSKGLAPEGALGRVGQQHAVERLDTGLKLDQLVSEYRALRASVLRLWEESQRPGNDEVTRFNEAIDETLAESSNWYSAKMTETREQFLAILGHDLRTPLGAIVSGAALLTDARSLDDKNARVATRILSSAMRMERLVHGLLDLTRTRLGAGIPIDRKPMNLVPVCQQVIAELETVHPRCVVQFEAKGDLHGEWDSDRLAQLVSNLVGNALQYGCEYGTVGVRLQERGKLVALQVHNGGPPIPEKTLESIFEPMVRSAENIGKNATGLGLGLFIAREIVIAHDGTIGLVSTKKEGTTFTVQLPRKPRPNAKRGNVTAEANEEEEERRLDS